MCHFIVCTSQLKAEDWLQIFSLQENLAFQAVAEVGGTRELRLVDHFVDSGGKYQTQVLPDLATNP
jgi:hypothetical protein